MFDDKPSIREQLEGVLNKPRETLERDDGRKAEQDRGEGHEQEREIDRDKDGGEGHSL
ncbi:hypothetical protein [Ruegeria meonggei]|uniref:hypothetical protein n=1 Tax=Ruegeria meonggei TaxID=1446476 RepID=UPI00366DC567